MTGGLYLSTVGRVLNWARSQSLWFLSVNSGCCADELLNTIGCRYDLERYGCALQADPKQSDLLIVSGPISRKAAPYLKQLYDSMLAPKHVMSIGACANSGGAFGPEVSYSVVPGLNQVLPVDVYVPGCPPRPEAIMNGFLALQDKIRGNKRALRQD
ncbi:MAG: hypothetical protein A2X94_09315 [Bdellovibrionales bacterium GWB1_55_8]|nr:MAG: hypothetical protein A2X94_09315 [Bdellovibrionales bacterium GWB1_55_8]